MTPTHGATDQGSKVDAPVLRICVEGEATPRFVTIRAAREVIVGRDPGAGLRLAHDAVSRHHLRLFERDQRWFAEDLGSRHGTMVDGVLLVPRRPVPVGPAATILVRPFALRVELGGTSVGGSFGSRGGGATPDPVVGDAPRRAAPNVPAPVDSSNDPESVVRTLDAAELNELNGRRLALLLEAAEQIYAARDERGVAEAATTALLTGTGFARALMLRWTAELDSLETLAVRTSADSDAVPSARVSRTLLRAASSGAPVLLEDQAPLRAAESIIGAGVAAALCAPVIVPPLVEAFLYLDSQRRSARPTPDAAAFCHLVAKLSGLAIANLRRVAAEQRQGELEQQLNAARRAQQRLLPAERGEIEGCRWRLFTRPGLVVAGDIAGVHTMQDVVTFFVGDVRGKGADAAIVMTMVASHLAACLEQGRTIDEAVTCVGRFVHRHRRDESDFVSLFVAQIDRGAGCLRTCDAGHGLVIRHAGSAMDAFESEGGPVLGISEGLEYRRSETPIGQGERLILYTDGVSEQHGGGAGEMLGVPQVMNALRAAESADSAVQLLSELLRRHAGSEVFADDVTILAIDI